MVDRIRTPNPQIRGMLSLNLGIRGTVKKMVTVAANLGIRSTFVVHLQKTRTS